MKNQRPELRIKNLEVARSKSFRLVVPDLQIRRGVVTCLVGANGSGKTSLVETIVGLLRPELGTVRIAGKQTTVDTLHVKRLIGYVPDDEAWLIPELTAAEYFALLASVHGSGMECEAMVQRSHQLANSLFFTNFDQQLVALSHGNKKKVQIIAGLLHSPRLLILDELRNGLDPIAIVQAEKLLKKERTRGATILAATHDLWWAERFADEILMIKDGEIILHETTKKIIKQSGSLEAAFMELYKHV